MPNHNQDKFYIVEWKYDGIQSKIEMILTLNPEIGSHDKIVVVNGVTELSVRRYHDPFDITYGDLEELNVSKKDNHYVHRLNTGDAIIEFVSTEEMAL